MNVPTLDFMRTKLVDPFPFTFGTHREIPRDVKKTRGTSDNFKTATSSSIAKAKPKDKIVERFKVPPKTIVRNPESSTSSPRTSHRGLGDNQQSDLGPPSVRATPEFVSYIPTEHHIYESAPIVSPERRQFSWFDETSGLWKTVLHPSDGGIADVKWLQSYMRTQEKEIRDTITTTPSTETAKKKQKLYSSVFYELARQIGSKRPDQENLLVNLWRRNMALVTEVLAIVKGREREQRQQMVDRLKEDVMMEKGGTTRAMDTARRDFEKEKRIYRAEREADFMSLIRAVEDGEEELDLYAQQQKVLEEEVENLKYMHMLLNQKYSALVKERNDILWRLDYDHDFLAKLKEKRQSDKPPGFSSDIFGQLEDEIRESSSFLTGHSSVTVPEPTVIPKTDELERIPSQESEGEAKQSNPRLQIQDSAPLSRQDSGTLKCQDTKALLWKAQDLIAQAHAATEVDTEVFAGGKISLDDSDDDDDGASVESGEFSDEETRRKFKTQFPDLTAKHT